MVFLQVLGRGRPIRAGLEIGIGEQFSNKSLDGWIWPPRYQAMPKVTIFVVPETLVAQPYSTPCATAISERACAVHNFKRFQKQLPLGGQPTRDIVVLC